MFRALVIAVTLTGMTLCQHRCTTACGAAAQADEPKIAATCPCCQDSHGPTNEDRPSRPCGDDGECDCQGICGGAVLGEAFAIDGLLLVWAARTVLVDVPIEPTAALSQPCGRNDVGKVAADGRALRIRIASLQT